MPLAAPVTTAVFPSSWSILASHRPLRQRQDGRAHVLVSAASYGRAPTFMTRFTDLVGCRLPLQLAGMTRVAGPELAAAVADAGGLGMIGVGRGSLEGLRATLSRIAELTDGPVGATFVVPYLNRDVFDAVAPQLPVVELFYGWPDAGLAAVAPLTGWQVGSLDEAKAAVDAGCAYVVAQGIEAGGHVRGTRSLLGLLDEVRQAVDVPVVAAGGIGTAAAVRAVLAAGADAVRVGTRFVAAAESEAHPRYVDALVEAVAADTVLTEAFGVGWPGRAPPRPGLGPGPRQRRHGRAGRRGRGAGPGPGSDPPLRHHAAHQGHHRRRRGHGPVRRVLGRRRAPDRAGCGHRRRADGRRRGLIPTDPGRATLVRIAHRWTQGERHC